MSDNAAVLSFSPRSSSNHSYDITPYDHTNHTNRSNLNRATTDYENSSNKRTKMYLSIKLIFEMQVKVHCADCLILGCKLFLEPINVRLI